MQMATRGAVWLLLLVHLGLALWAVVGFVELIVAEPPWRRLSNPLFGRAMLATQWSLVLLAAVVFIGGYAARWTATPHAMTGIYAAMALVCAVQTFTILRHDGRFVAMAVEYAAYVAILLFMYRAEIMRERFGALGSG